MVLVSPPGIYCRIQGPKYPMVTDREFPRAAVHRNSVAAESTTAVIAPMRAAGDKAALMETRGRQGW